MSHPDPHNDPENTHPPRTHKKSPERHIADFHKDQMSHMMNLMRGHAKSKAIKKKQK